MAKILEPGQLAEGRVRTVTVGRHSLAVSCYQGAYGALDNRCPHQGGPLGEGSIENGAAVPVAWLRLQPLAGSRPRGSTMLPLATQCRNGRRRVRGAASGGGPNAHRVGRDGRDPGAMGGAGCFGMVGHSNLGFADALREAEQRGDCAISYPATRGRPRSRLPPTASSLES